MRPDFKIFCSIFVFSSSHLPGGIYDISFTVHIVSVPDMRRELSSLENTIAHIHLSTTSFRYNVMLMCWAANPEERLSFIDLSGIFNNVLGNRSVRITFIYIFSIYIIIFNLM